MNLKLNLILAALSLTASGVAQAETFDITLTDGNTTIGSGSVVATDDSGGTFTATSGTLTLANLVGGTAFELDPLSGQSNVTIHPVANTGGTDLSGDDLIINNNNLDGDGLIFTSPQTTVNGSSFSGDVYNLWGNGGNSFTLAYGGPDFSSGLHLENVTGSISEAPEPSTWSLMFLSLGVLFYFRRQRCCV